MEFFYVFQAVCEMTAKVSLRCSHVGWWASLKTAFISGFELCCFACRVCGPWLKATKAHVIALHKSHKSHVIVNFIIS